jgi:sugar lactone lactonase YvrE
MKIKRSLSLILILALCLTLGLPAAAAGEGYGDVSPSDWYYEAVTFCTEHGLMTGTGEGMFTPEGSVSRAMAVTVLYRMASSPAVGDATGFPDVEAGTWYSKPVSWASRVRIANGYDYGWFGPEDPITREQLAVFLWRYCGSPDSAPGADFADEAKISAYADEAVDWVRAGGIINGRPGNLYCPQETCTRAELAQLLMNFMRSEAYREWPSYLSELDVLTSPCGVAITSGGLLLVADGYHRVVWQAKNGVASVYAGVSDEKGYRDSTLDDTLFASPWAIVPFLDGWAVSDPENNAVRMVRMSGTETVNPQTEEPLEKNEIGVVFAHPTGLATDDDGNLYVSDTFNGAIRKVDTAGNLVTVIDGLNGPMGLAWHEGALYCAETGANRILRIVEGRAEVFAGSGEDDYLNGPASSAAFSAPQALAVGPDGTVYVSDTANGAVRTVKNGMVDTLIAQSDDKPDSVPVSPMGLLVSGGTLYVCDSFSRKVFTIPVN